MSVVMTTSEGNIGLHVDNDGEVEDDEADHQMLVDSESWAAQGTRIEMRLPFLFKALKCISIKCK